MKWTTALCLCCLLLASLSGGLRADPGKWFLVAFPQAYTDPTLGSCLRMTGVSAQEEVSVTLSTHPSAPSPVSLSRFLQPGEISEYCVDSVDKLLPVGTLISNMTLEIVSSKDIVVEVVNTVRSNGDIFSPIPVNKLGKDYFAAAGTKKYDVTASFVTVSAPYDDTEVTLTFPPEQRKPFSDDAAAEAASASRERFVLQGVTYFRNDVITFRLKRLQTMQLQSTADLTGTRVNSSKPVAVLSGQNRTSLSGKLCLSHLLEQMPPTSHFAFTFTLIHLPGQTAGDYYRFVAKEPMTTLTLAGGAQVLRIQDPGGFAEYDLKDKEFVSAVADKPVMAVQYTREQPRAVTDRGDPAMMILSPWEHATDVYHIVTEPGPHELYVVVTVLNSDKDSVKLNGRLLSLVKNVTWHAVTGSANHVVGHVSLEQSDAPCALGENGGPKMNAHVYYASRCECWAMALTHGQVVNPTSGPIPRPSCPAQSYSAGDGIDNDCDGAIDEEPCYVNSEPLDTDVDYYKNEDCAKQDIPMCISPRGTGIIYACQELKKSSHFFGELSSRRNADTMQPVPAESKIACAVTCASTTGCWGTNFDPEGREGHRCELLLGWGRGLVAATGWTFQSMKSYTTFSNP